MHEVEGAIIVDALKEVLGEVCNVCQNTERACQSVGLDLLNVTSSDEEATVLLFMYRNLHNQVVKNFDGYFGLPYESRDENAQE